MTWQKMALIVVPVIALALCAPSAARAGFMTNGDFSQTSNGAGQLGFNTNANGWTTSGYNFLFTPGLADTTGTTGSDGNLQLWGPHNGSANGLPASSPVGGNFIAADGAFEIGAISQTLSGLTVGNQYTVGFWWAGAQQSNRTGVNTEQWQVSFGSATQSTVVVNNSSEGFTGWVHQTFTFTADKTNDVLSFLAVGTPSGVPPFSLLAGVSVVPEPGSIVLIGVGVVGFGVVRLRRRAKSTVV
jgi:hypothetical protein